MKVLNIPYFMCLTLCFSLCNAEFEIRPEVLSKARYKKMLHDKKRMEYYALIENLSKDINDRTYVYDVHLRESIEEVKAVKRRALEGNLDDIVKMAGYYQYGYIVNENHAKAEEFYKKAIALGHVESMYQLGLHYMYGLEGLGIKFRDEVIQERMKLAATYFLQAHEKGHMAAKYELSLMYNNGEYFKKSPKTSAELLKEAASANEDSIGYYEGAVSRAQNNLAVYYLNGYGVRKDTKKAAALFRESALKLTSTALGHYANLLRKGIGVKKNVELADYCLDLSLEFSDETKDYRLQEIPYIQRVQFEKDNKRLLLELPRHAEAQFPDFIAPDSSLIRS